MIVGTAQPTTSNRCDVTHDSVINVVDIQAMINEVRGIAPAVDDLDGDGAVNAADVPYTLTAALGFGCFSVPRTHVVGSVPISIENGASPVPSGALTYVIGGLQFSIENSAAPFQSGALTHVLAGLPFSLENSASPFQSGALTQVLAGLPYSLENTASPLPVSPWTYEIAGLPFSLFNGSAQPTQTSGASTASLRFRIPVDQRTVALILAHAAANASGEARCLDSDGDGLCDADELILGTSPYLADSDGDGYPDGLELALGSDPLDPKSVPAIDAPGYYVTPPLSIRNIISYAILKPKRQGAIYATEVR